jgi:hypothetical protein
LLTRKFYLDCKGKDAGGSRYRINFYYDDGHASCLFFKTEKKYGEFIVQAGGYAYVGFEKFRKYCMEDEDE